MKVLLRKSSSSRVLALALCVSALGCAAFAQVSAAAIPTGVNCVAADGKINGRGATFQTAAQTLFAQGFRDDVCGAVTSDADAADTMVAYNYAAANSNSGTGSGAGRVAMQCRTDAFAGSDTPYDTATLATLNGAPGPTLGACPSTWTGPFAPNASPFPNAADQPNNLMSFPVAGSAVTIITNLSAVVCGTGTSTTQIVVKLTAKNVSDLFGGNIASWNSDATIVTNNPSLAACAVPVVRVVRFDSSGTTQIFKNYLKNADSARTGSVCEGTNVAGGPNPWDTFALNANNRSWPGTLTDPAPLGTCTSLVTGGANGNGPEITKVKATPGGVGYADLADAVAGQVAPIPYQIASVRNATDTLFVAPRSGRAANCNLGVASLPGSSNADAVGLNTTGDTWALDNAPNHGDATGAGSAYPICGLTWALVYSGLADGSVNNLANPITRLSQNQRRTLYSYESYILSSAAQDRLSSAFYISLPPAWLVKLRGGFQAAY